MQRQKLFTTINILGFAIGIAACLVMGLYIYHESSYDRDHPNGERIVRVVGYIKQGGITHTGLGFPAPMAKALLADFPQIEKAGRLMPNALMGGARNQVRRPDQSVDTYEEGFCFADSTIPDLLNIHMIYGNRSRALAEPFSILICKSMADKYFPGRDPVGQPMVFNDNLRMPIKVGGVMEDFPSSSHLSYRAFISLSSVNFWDGEQQSWTSSNYPIYFQLKEGTDRQALESAITNDVINHYMIPAMRAAGQSDFSTLKSAHIGLQALKDIHLRSYAFDSDYISHGDIRIIWLFAGIAIFTLLLACINFLNLSTARSANRAKEVGLRKVIGSARRNLIGQFLTESFLYSFIACCLAIAFTLLSLPGFNKIAGTSLSIPRQAWWLIPALPGFALVIGLLAGLYPAFYLSHFKPIQVLKGTLSLGSKNSRLRSGLVVFQFTVSILLLIATTVVYRQMRFVLGTRIGFDKDQVVMIQGADALRDHSRAFRDELAKLPNVQAASVSDYLPVGDTKRNGNTFWKSNDHSPAGVQGQIWRIDEHYLPTLGLRLVAGRNFLPDMRTDSQSCIINQAMALEMGYKDPIGKVINNGENRTIIGVVENFYFESMKRKVLPLSFVLGESKSIISVKVKGNEMAGTLVSLQSLWKKFVPSQSMRYVFMDQEFAGMYSDIQRTQYIFSCFAVLAIVIACLGLFALAAFMAEQRQKEISIRKVLGAPISSLFALLTGSFLKLVLLSFAIAAPLGWWLMNGWLQDYAYRVHLSPDLFALAGATVLLIALATVCWQAIRATLANPVTSLRSE